MKAERKDELLWLATSIIITEIGAFLAWFYLGWYNDLISTLISMIFAVAVEFYLIKQIYKLKHKRSSNFFSPKALLKTRIFNAVAFVILGEAIAFAEWRFIGTLGHSIFLIMLGLMLSYAYFTQPQKSAKMTGV